MMLLSQALVKLLQVWDNNLLGELPEDLVCEQIPILLFQILVHTLQKQTHDGSWRFKSTSRETTAYAVLTLKALSSIPWLSHFQDRIQGAITRGSAHLVLKYDLWNHYEHIWVAKVTYALPPLARAYIVAALCAGTSYNWGAKAKSLVTVSHEKVQKMAKFFSTLPMFSRDELWALEADVFLGYLYQPQLLRVSSSVFQLQENADHKYFEYIPFTWIATNRMNNNPISNNTLWEMMRISVLIYQLDEFMETLFSRGREPESIALARQLVEELFQSKECELGAGSEVPTTIDHSSNGRNGSIRSCTQPDPTSGHAKAVLQSFTSCILQHPAVLQSPDHVRKQLQRELRTGILAHLDHEEDNARYCARDRAHAIPGLLPTSSQPIPFASARTSYYSWVRNTSADNTQTPSIFTFFSCLIAPPGESFFRGVRQHYFSSALCRHLANLCREYNDYGSIARDQAEGNLNSLDFPEFHETCEIPVDQENGNGVHEQGRDQDAMKMDLFSIAEYERECLDHATTRLSAEMRGDQRGEWKAEALKVFINTVDLYGQIYIARDISSRVR